MLTRRAREVALTQHIGVSAETDRAVVPKLRQAYDSLVCGRRRLGAIGAEIENAVAHQRALGLDTPAGARNFSRFLATKAHDITRVLAATAAESQAGAARLRSLASSYQAVGFGPKP
ncbi:Biofilm regulator, BssS [Mycobacterium tuberculosis]|nr:PF10774 domain protein [Mycobacterium tuberculosis]CFH68603.1 Biofilm regulator%2C BssS [Mycobacterium tuberculosis]CFS61603.1 Biofilm regulator%2C BssS [Mycobacterium tuberculosis]CLT84825.1 Biofilm regulator%2C BssS [Mycobacterium tuberculosis]CMA28389.1 Biofilm regulator%2C BssS [Mycobacterium tuberculosis]